MVFMEKPVAGFARTLLHRVYGWMAAGLATTAITAYIVANTPAFVEVLFKNIWLIFVLFIAQLALVVFLSFRIQRMSFVTAVVTFLLYSLLTGVTLSSIFFVYTQSSIAITFAVAAGMFFAMALYGFFTKADLSGMGNFLLMGLIGLIIALFVNMFLRSTTFDYIISAFGVVIFSLLTAYDVQRIKMLSQQLEASGMSAMNIAILGALMLYLDFINLFLYLLRFMGQRKE